MRSYAAVSVAQLRQLQEAIREGAREASAVEEAAQRCVSALYEPLAEVTALARLYITVPYGALPAGHRAFVERLANAGGVHAQLQERTPVLTLAGTRGKLPEWNDRARSKGHVGIPLAATSFVAAIPMIARLLQDMGVALDWLDPQDVGMVERLMDGGLAGLFYVADAASSRDSAGRLIVPAQDFVRSEGVRTVFGVGGSYIGGAFATLIVFTREDVPRAVAQRFVPLINVFKASTTALVMRGQYLAR